MTLILNRADLFRCSPDAVLFDTDNTLYPYEPAHKAAMDAVRVKAAMLFGIEKEKFNDTFYRAREAVKEQLSNTASSHSRLLYFQRMLEMMGLGSQVRSPSIAISIGRLIVRYARPMAATFSSGAAPALPWRPLAWH